MSDLIPPAVIDITASDTGFLATIAADSAILQKWADTVTSTHLGADSKPFQADLATVKTELLDFASQITNAKLGADSAPFWAEIMALRAAVDAMSPLDIDIDANISNALAQIAALKGAAASAQVGALADAAARSGGGGGGGSAGLLGLLGGGGGGGGLAGLLGWGTGFGGMAGFGTLGSLLGFGAESALTTLLGVAGSAAGGALGGGALALGGLGVGAVGMGTDLAGIGQAGGDIKTYTSDLNALNRAIAVYGPGSIQATAATYDFNQAMADIPPKTQAAIAAASATGQAFHSMFDQATGSAEAKGAEIINQLMQVGEKFLPTIGAFASQNMTIIQSSLQPLLSWIQGPGLSVFQELEQTFQEHLPAAMGAFDNGIELLIRVLGFLAPYTGHLVDDLDRWMTALNGADFGRLTGGITTTIGIFRDWEGLIKAIGTAIYLLFSHDAGTGSGLVVGLTNLINQFNAWVRTVSGGDALHSLLESHKEELLSIIQVLGHVISVWGQLELVVRPFLMDLITGLADVLNFLFQIPGVGQIMGLVLAFEILGSHVGLLNGLLGSFNGFLKNLALEGLHILGAALVGLGGPFTALGTWLSGLGVEGDSEITVLTGAVDRLNASIAGIGATAAESATEFDAAMASMDASAGGAAAAAKGVAGAEVGEEAAGAGTGAAGVGLGAVAGVAALAALPAAIYGLIGFLGTRGNHLTPQQTANVHAADSGGGTPTKDGGINYAALFPKIDADAAAPINEVGTNVAELAKATGLAQSNVLALATALKINLKSALSPGEIEQFTNDVKNAGGATGETAALTQAASLKMQAALTQLSNKARQEMPNIPASVRTAIVSTQPELLKLVTDLNKTGDQSGAGFVTAFLAHLPASELASKQMHDGMKSPLFPLEEELRAIGDTSGANAVAAFIAHQPAASRAAGLLHDSIKNPLYNLETELGATGNVAAAQLIQEFIKHNPEAATQSGLMHDAITGKLAPLESALQSIGDTSAANLVAALGAQTNKATTAASALGAAIDSGLASGITSNNGVVINSINGIVQQVISAGKTGLKAASPSRLTADELGAPIAQGIAMGMLENARLVQNATHMLVSVPGTVRVPAFSASNYGAGGGATPAGGGAAFSPTYNVTIWANGSNGQQVGAQFRKAMQEHDNDLVRRLSAGSISSAGD